MKIARRKLENIIKEELEALLEQGIDPVTGQPVTIGGQASQSGPLPIGQSSKLAAKNTAPRPTEEEFANEPVATYVMQRLDSVVFEIFEMLEDLKSKVENSNTVPVARQSKQIKEFTNEPDPGQRDLGDLRARFTVSDKAKTGFGLDRSVPYHSGEDYSEIEAYMSQRLVRVTEKVLDLVRKEFETVYNEIETLRNRIVEPDDPEDYPVDSEESPAPIVSPGRQPK